MMRTGHRPRRRHDGRADRGALRQRRHSDVLLLDVSRRRGPRRHEARARAEARSVLHADAHAARHDRRLRRAGSTPLAGADWMIEAVVERLDVKQELFASVDAARRAATRSSARTPRASRSRALAEGRSDGFRRHFARHALLQPAALPAAARDHPDAGHRSRRASRRSPTFADRRLGKGVVVAKDTPNFIGNHIGLYGDRADPRRAGRAGRSRSRRSTRSPARPSAGRRARRSGRWTSPASTCWSHVARNLARAAGRRAERAPSRCRRWSTAMVERGWIGEKAGQGFYKRRESAGGERRS